MDAESPILANVVIESESLTTIAGFQDGTLGDHLIGRLPGELFQDGQDRDLASAYTLSDTRELYLVYSGGQTQDWKADLDSVLLELRYEDGRDPLRFVLGGFVESRTGDYNLRPGLTSAEAEQIAAVWWPPSRPRPQSW